LTSCLLYSRTSTNVTLEEIKMSYTVTPTQLVPLVDHLTSRINSRGETKAMVAPFIWGAPGIGKTAIVKAIAANRKSRVVALHLPQFDPTDIKGIPVKGNDGKVRWMPSNYLPQEQYFFNVSTVMNVTFDYAIDVAVYGFVGGKEVYRWNDPMLPNVDDFKMGAAKITNKSTEWDVWIPKADNTVEFRVVDKAILFLDELSAAEPSVQNAALQLVLDRRISEYDLPTGVPVIAAGNREDDGGFVQMLSHPLCNRFVHLTLVPNADDFINWGLSNNKRPEILGFIKANPDALMDYNPDTLVNGNYGFATPRSYEFLSDQYEEFNFFKGIAKNKRSAEHLRMTLFAGIIGQSMASRFVAYLQVMHDLPSIPDIISGKAKPLGKIERSKTFGLLYSLVYAIKANYDDHYVGGINEDETKWEKARTNIINYITENFQKEESTWAGTVIMQNLGIELKSLSSDAMRKFAHKNAEVLLHTIGRGK